MKMRLVDLYRANAEWDSSTDITVIIRNSEKTMNIIDAINIYNGDYNVSYFDLHSVYLIKKED